MSAKSIRKGYVQLNLELPSLTKDKLRGICDIDKRSMTAEVEWLIERRSGELKDNGAN